MEHNGIERNGYEAMHLMMEFKKMMKSRGN